MKKKLLFVAMTVLLIIALLVPATMALAAGKNGPAGKSDVGHINLVEKDGDGLDNIWGTEDDWSIVEDGAWGKLRYQLNDSTLDVVLNAHGLVPGDWYYIEVVDKSNSGWNPISPNNYSSFYVQANGGGNIHAAFSQAVTSGMLIEANVKNAEWAALLEPSTIGVGSEWAGPTGQGWDYVLYSADTIAIP